MFTILYETGILIKLSFNVRTENQEQGLKTQIHAQILNKSTSLGTLASTSMGMTAFCPESVMSPSYLGWRPLADLLVHHVTELHAADEDPGGGRPALQLAPEFEHDPVLGARGRKQEV